jgi:5-methylcytosine-specific restriction endonuclease McrA
VILGGAGPPALPARAWWFFYFWEDANAVCAWPQKSQLIKKKQTRTLMARATPASRTRTKRVKIPTGIRLRLAASQEWTCNICGKLLSAAFDVDHIVALENGGSNFISNLQALCRACHASKTYIDNYPHLHRQFLADEPKLHACLVL